PYTPLPYTTLFRSEVDPADRRRTARYLEHIELRAGHEDVLNRAAIRLGDHFSGIQSRTVEWDAQHSAARCMAERHQVEEAIPAERRPCGLIGERGDLRPLRGRAAYKVLDLAAVAIVDAG